MTKTLKSSIARRVGKYPSERGFGGKNHPWEREANYALAMGLMQTMFCRYHFSKPERNRILRNLYRYYKPPLSDLNAEKNHP